MLVLMMELDPMGFYLMGLENLLNLLLLTRLNSGNLKWIRLCRKKSSLLMKG